MFISWFSNLLSQIFRLFYSKILIFCTFFFFFSILIKSYCLKISTQALVKTMAHVSVHTVDEAFSNGIVQHLNRDIFFLAYIMGMLQSSKYFHRLIRGKRFISFFTLQMSLRKSSCRNVLSDKENKVSRKL